MVHLLHNDDIRITIKFGHPQKGVVAGASLCLPFSQLLAVEIWQAVAKNIGTTECIHECSRQWYPILYARPFFDLLLLASKYAWWPYDPTIT